MLPKDQVYSAESLPGPDRTHSTKAPRTAILEKKKTKMVEKSQRGTAMSRVSMTW